MRSLKALDSWPRPRFDRRRVSLPLTIIIRESSLTIIYYNEKPACRCRDDRVFEITLAPLPKFV